MTRVLASDSIRLPPSRSETFSPNGRYVFAVVSEDGWRSKYPIGRLFEVSDRGRRLVWSERLPQEYGPRYILVGDGGQVLMLDEWINVKSPTAVLLINHAAGVRKRHTFEAVRDRLGVPASRLVERGAGGSWWISALPTLDPSGAVVLVPAGEALLRVDLGTGVISR